MQDIFQNFVVQFFVLSLRFWIWYVWFVRVYCALTTLTSVNKKADLHVIGDSKWISKMTCMSLHLLKVCGCHFSCFIHLFIFC